MARLPWLLIATLLSLCIPATTSGYSKGSEPYVWCYNCGPGVTRLDAGVAAQTACNHYYGQMMERDQPSGSGLQFKYIWSPYTTITLTIVPQWEQPDCDPAINDFMFNATRCYYTFMAPIDDCNTAGVNGKKGGYSRYYCAAAMTNTDPKDCSGGYTAGSSSRVMAALNGNTPVGGTTTTYHATEEEHQAAAAALLASPDFADDCSEDETMPVDGAITSDDEAAPAEDDIIVIPTADVEPDPSLQNRAIHGNEVVTGTIVETVIAQPIVTIYVPPSSISQGQVTYTVVATVIAQPVVTVYVNPPGGDAGADVGAAAAPNLQKRDPTTCFDEHSSVMECYGVDRTLA